MDDEHQQTKSSTRLLYYLIGVIVRIVWTLIYPQKGYIHPVGEMIMIEKPSNVLFFL